MWRSGHVVFWEDIDNEKDIELYLEEENYGSDTCKETILNSKDVKNKLGYFKNSYLSSDLKEEVNCFLFGLQKSCIQNSRSECL